MRLMYLPPLLTLALCLLAGSLCLHALPSEADFFNQLSARDETCRTSLDAYKTLHKQISQGALPPRFVHVQCASGLADMLKGLVSAFFYALLSGRAVKLANLAMGAAYSSDLDLFSPSFVGGGLSSFHGQSAVFHATGWPHPLQASPLFQAFAYGTNMSRVYEDKAHVFLETGFLMPLDRLLNNTISVHAGELQRMGFTLDNIFRCSLNFLIRPQPEIFDTHELIFREVLGKAQPARLFGVHLRIGDAAFWGNSFPTARVNEFIKYIREIEAKTEGTGGSSATFLLSDSKLLRQYVKSVMGNGVITNVDATPQHTWMRDTGEQHRAEATRLAVAELSLLSNADTLLLSKGNYGIAAGLLRSKAPKAYRCIGTPPKWPYVVRKFVDKVLMNKTMLQVGLKCEVFDVTLQSIYSPEMKRVLRRQFAGSV